MLVAIDDAHKVIERRRLGVIREGVPGGKQPYHHAAQLGLPAAERYLSGYVSECNRVARGAVEKIVTDLQDRFLVVRAAILEASGRNLPPLPQVLAAHPLIHTAEGKLFRDVISCACESLNLAVLKIPERELEKFLTESLAAAAPKIINLIAAAGKSLGPPWNADYKSAALAACVALESAKHTSSKTKASNG